MPTLDHCRYEPILPRLPRRYGPALFSFIMSTTIVAVTSSMITAINTGVDAHYVERWLRAYAMAWSFAFPTVMLVGPRVRRFVDSMVAGVERRS